LPHDHLRDDLGREVLAGLAEETGDLAQPALALRVLLLVGGLTERLGQAGGQALRGGPLPDRAPGIARDLRDRPQVRDPARREPLVFPDVGAVKRLERPVDSLTTVSRTGRSLLTHVSSIAFLSGELRRTEPNGSYRGSE